MWSWRRPSRWSAQTPGSDSRRRGQSVMSARRLAEALFTGKHPGRSDHRLLGWIGIVAADPAARSVASWDGEGLVRKSHGSPPLVAFVPT
jgi:hypothetical protein